MTDLDQIRQEIQRDLDTPFATLASDEDAHLDDDLRRLRTQRLPSPLVIAALAAGAEEMELPEGWQSRRAMHRAELTKGLFSRQPSFGELIRARRGTQSSRDTAHALGLSPGTWAAIEDGSAPAALLKVDPERVRRLTDDLGIDPQGACLAASSLLARRASAGPSYALGYRPRQPVEENAPLESPIEEEPAKVWTWLLAFIEPSER